MTEKIRKPKKLTAAFLKRRFDACDPGMEPFKEAFPEGMTIDRTGVWRAATSPGLLRGIEWFFLHQSREVYWAYNAIERLAWTLSGGYSSSIIYRIGLYFAIVRGLKVMGWL